jgi:hypothetical protein
MAMWATARSGDWLTPARMRAYPLILLTLFSLAAGGIALLSHDRMGPNNLPLGSDFSQVWIAGREVLAGYPEAPFDIERHAAAQRAEFASASGVFGWHYPPYFLAPAALLARLPYLQALFVWQFATLALYLAAMLGILRGSNLSRGSIVVAALAYPAVALNLGHGQNGFFTAALLGGGFALLHRRPALAGALFALLAYKPQFGLALPLFLLMGRNWRAISAAAATLAAMTALSVAAFGLESWRAFFESLAFTRSAVVEQGATGFEKIQTVFAAVRLMGGDIAAAYFWQSVAGLSAFAALALLLRSGADWRVKAAATIGAALLATPYSLDYDMMALAPAMALLLAHGLDKGFAPFEKTVLAATYAAPLLARPIATILPAPLGVAALVAFFATTVSHAYTSKKQ